MAMLSKYRDYFDIDPEYFPQVNDALINTQPDLWKKFYPHETFVKLVKDTISVVSRKQKVSIWVEGAYGTGKSHAVLTLKKLLDASEQDTKEYFERYKNELNNDLYNQFQQIKSGNQKILTVHRYGSSSIHGDGDLVFALQDSIINALKAAGFKGQGYGALKDSAVQWLSQGWAKNAFDELIANQYADLFLGDDVDTVISKLNSFKGEALLKLMSKIMKVADEQHFSALTMDTTSLVRWIEAVIEENNLKSIVFIWDEFTDYLRNNMRAMTGFQEIVDFSGSKPFYLIIVTHNVTHIFPETDKDWKRTLGRFVQPICNIELPENMAFRLMGEAMKISADTQIQADWQETRDELYDRTQDSRQLVKTKASITDMELNKILPIHPYAALLLKHISSAFDSNQRSMFDFIKNDRGDEIKGFQWFIDNCGPFDENPLLTIDMLWDFFYEKGKEYLARDIRAILDCYSFAATKQLNKDEKRVLKTVLLLQAISQNTGDTVELFLPNEKNLNNAFEGSDLENDEATRIADRLIPDVLFKKPLPGGKMQYSALINTGNAVELDKQRTELRKKTTSQLIQEADIESAIVFSGALRLRYIVNYVSVSDFASTLNRLKNLETAVENQIIAVIVFAKDDAESASINKLIADAMKEDTFQVVFIDASVTPLGNDLMEQYVEAMANSIINLQQDRGLAAQYESNAKEVLKKWRAKISSGEFIVYTANKPQGERVPTIDLLYSTLAGISRRIYNESLETGNPVTETMWQSTSLPAGVECGIKEITTGTFRSSNAQTKLENYIGDDAWQVKEYWKKSPYLPISKIKIEVDRIINDAFEKDGRIAISQVFDFLKAAPYGFMPCNLTAFVMGFILKEYADNTYTWSDGLINDVLSPEKMKEMVAEIIKHQATPIPRYKEKYIVAMTDEEKAFNEASSVIFDIQKNLCSSVEQTRERIRQKMKENLSFPIWSLKYILDRSTLKTDVNKVISLIDYYSGIANNSNFRTAKTDSDIALNIGKLCMDNPDLIGDLKVLATKTKCKDGMDAYLHLYCDGILINLSKNIGDDGQYINRLKKKFDADAANWVWNIETANQKIEEVILEYKIIVTSNKILPKNISFDATVREWCDRCSLIRISYLYAKSYWNDLSVLMELLYGMKKSGQLLDSQREKFLEQISVNGSVFNEFYNNQVELFKKCCSFLLGQFSDEEVRSIFKLVPGNVFIDEKSSYQNVVQNAVDKYVREQGVTKLKELWYEKTGTDSPRVWSQKYLTPILCIIDDDDIKAARSAFITIERKQPDINAIERATEFLKYATFYDRMSSQEDCDTAFRNTIVKSYSVMLEDLNEVRTYLKKHVDEDPYNWFDMLSVVEKKLKDMAEFKYNESGCERALAKIDDMDVADVKQYLKKLIRDNMVVGMEIIKGK